MSLYCNTVLVGEMFADINLLKILIYGNTVAMIVMGVILSSIIIVQFVVIIFVIRKSQAVCVKKSGERKPHIYDQPNKESHYDYIDSCYKSVEI
ncbi:cell adhesion molecule 2 [Biomphalaria pfeifferi]|uniref:Cell adhesion molecule 2 n=1 Tax=Biomphalaria pfeifferi TaxID=112525 RepID=A0AAD8CA44_BIOPF|nr:cell adhesion molecule 2 [Biomphalaria pfeifferi]